MKPSRKRWLALLGLLVALLAGWGLTTNEVERVWLVRNTLQYRLLHGWWGRAGLPEAGEAGTLRGTVRDADGQPIAGATVLAARWDGATFHARSDEDGVYRIETVPAGRYQPVAGAPGFADVTVGRPWRRVEVRAGVETVADVTLPRATLPTVPPGENLAVGEPTRLRCEVPLASKATRRTIEFERDGQPNTTTFLYLPITATAESALPTLLAVYPGPADEWECTSLPLAAAGYAVLAIGPAYSLDVERDIDELQQLLAFARAGALPGASGERLAALGGSYSALLAQRLLARDADLDAAVLLGAPTDLFDMRRRFEREGFVPPFDLDKVLVALGFPDREPLRYWRYSGAYHVRPDLPPLALFHSRTDEIVPYQQSTLLAEQLELAGVPHELHFFEGGNHYLLDRDRDALEIYRLTLDFLGRHLRP